MRGAGRRERRSARRQRRAQRRRAARLRVTEPVVLDPLEPRLLFTAASIVSVAPLANSHTAAAAADITATYDQAINATTVSLQTFAVHAMFSGRLVDPPHGSTLGVSGDTITFNPDDDFKPGEHIEVIATSGIQNTLAEASTVRVWRFVTAPIGGSGVLLDSGQNLGSHASHDVTLGDLDGDGDLDAFIANLGEANRVWINDDSGNFTDSGQALGNHSSEGVALGDLDGDGDLDAFVTNLDQGNRVWNNDGSGNFTDSGQTLGSQESEDVALGDLNGDGAVDAFVTNINATNRAWINDGSGNFTESGQILGNHDSRGVALGDLDSDGDLDAFVTNRIQANRVWTNDGSGNFTDGGQQLGDHHSYAVSLGDLDGDGDLDAFVANGFPGEGNRVWLNQELPQVTEVLVRGSAWTQTFLNHLDSLSLGTDGFSIAVGSLSQLDALPWLNIDQILIRFNEQVNVDLNDLTLTGVNVATYSLASVTTGTGATGDFEAVWTLTAPIASDKLRIRLDGTTGGAVTDTSGNALDGEWIDTVSTYPSGDVAAGGDFAFRFNVLPADFNGDGVVTLNPDLQNLLAGNGASIGAGTYSPFIDLNGDGVVTLNPDLQTGLSNNGTFLPLGDPIAPGTPGEGTSPTLGAATATPATSATTKPDGTTVAVERVIAIRSRNQASEPPLNTTMFASDRTATDSIFVDSPGVLDKKDLTSGAILDLDDLDSIVSVDLLSEADSIF